MLIVTSHSQSFILELLENGYSYCRYKTSFQDITNPLTPYIILGLTVPELVFLKKVGETKRCTEGCVWTWVSLIRCISNNIKFSFDLAKSGRGQPRFPKVDGV